MTIIKIGNHEIKPACYSDRELAFASLDHAVKPLRVMLGDDCRYWVVTPADAQRLERAGYEWA